MESKLKREVERERAKGNEERRKSLFFDLLDSFTYTGGSRRRRRRGGGGPCWIPSFSVTSNERKPTNPTPPSTPSPLKRPHPISFTNKPNKKPRHHLPKEATTAPPPPITAAVKKPKKPRKPHHGDTSSGACAGNVNKVTKSFYFTNKPNKKPRHHLPKEDMAAPSPPITAAVKKPHDGDTSSGACVVNVKKVTKSRNLPKAAMAVNVNTVTVNKKKKETIPFGAADKRSEAYRRVPPDFNFKPPRSCHHLIQEDHTFDHWRVLVICMLLNMTSGKQVKKVVEDFFVLCPDAETTTKVDTQQIQNVISTLGLHNKRAHMIKRLSEEYLRPDWTHVTSLHGIGKYAADAYAIFCTGKGADVRPQDHKLVDYWNSIYGNDTSSHSPM